MSNLVTYAEDELKRAGFFDEDSDYGGMLGEAVMRMIKNFADEGHSGFSAHQSLAIFNRLANFKPLTPLTGEDNEWKESDLELGVFQNKRCNSVFKRGDRVYDIDALVVLGTDPDGATWTKAKHEDIHFPYHTPDKPKKISETGEPIDGFTFDFYQSRARSTAKYPGGGEIMGLLYTAIGLTGEAGETADQVKKILRDDKMELTDERKDKLKNELGDVLWYVANMAHELGITLEDVARRNIQKLADRKERGVLCGDGGRR